MLRGNKHIKQVTFSSILRSKPFGLGYLESQFKFPMNYKLVMGENQGDAMRYERGRQFGLLHPGLTLKQGNAADRKALVLYTIARQQRDIL